MKRNIGIFRGVAASLLTLSLLLVACRNFQEPVAVQTSSSVAAGQAPAVELPSEEQAPEPIEAEPPVFDVLPTTYENSIQQAIYTFRWTANMPMYMDDNMRYGPYRYSVHLLDIDLDGRLEILVTGRTRYQYGTDACLVLKVQDGELVRLGGFDIERGQTVADFLEGGKIHYYQNANGEYVLYYWMRTAMGESNALMELSLVNLVSRPVVLYSNVDYPEEFWNYYYFDSDNFAYQPGGVIMEMTPEHIAGLGYINITKEEYEQRQEVYFMSLADCGELEPIDVMEYPKDAFFYNGEEKFAGFEDNGEYVHPKSFNLGEPEKYEPYTEAINTYVAKKIYEAYMLKS